MTNMLQGIKSPSSPFYSPRGVLGGGGGGGGLGTPSGGNNNNGGAGGGLSLSNIPILITAFFAILATGGPTYSFGMYSAALKRTLDLTQTQIETLGSASFAAGFISWIPGLFVDTWGSRKAIMLGGLGQTIGMILYWIVVTTIRFSSSSTIVVSILSFLSVLIFTSNNMVIGGVFKSIVVTCGLGTKGKAVGAAKAYLGMGSGVLTSLFRTLPIIIRNNDLNFLLMTSCTSFLAIVVPAAVALPTKDRFEKKGTKDESTSQHYNLVYSGLFAVALVVVGSSIMDLLVPTTTSSTTTATAVPPDWVRSLIILTVWIGPILGLMILPTHSTNLQQKYQRQQSVLRRKVRKAMEEHHQHEKMFLLPPQQHQQQQQQSSSTTSNNKTSAVLIMSPRTTYQSTTATNSGSGTSIPQQPQASSRSITSFASNNNNNNNNVNDEGEGGGEALDEDDEEFGMSMSSIQQQEQQQETPQPIPDLTLLEMLCTVEAWLFIGASTILVGSGTMLTINMGQMVQAQQQEHGLQPEIMTSACLALFSVSQALARVAAGSISEAALQWKLSTTASDYLRCGVPRPAFLVLSCSFAIVGHSLLAVSSSSLIWFVLGIVFTGFSFGALWPLMVLIVGDLFGTVNHGANYMFMDGFTCAVGTLSVAKFLTQFFYEQHLLLPSPRDDNTSPANACYGDECFRMTHTIIALLCMVAFLACAALLYMTRSSYGYGSLV